MKKCFILTNLLVIWTLAAIQASPLISLGDHASIFFDGYYSAIWQSNVLYEDSDEQEDFISIITPGLELDVGGEQSNFDLNVGMHYDIYRYNELTDFDREYFRLKAISSYKTARWGLDGLVSFEEKQSTAGQENLVDAGGNTDNSDKLILFNDTNANLTGRYQYSPKFSFESGLLYFDRNYRNNVQLSDRESFTIPLDVFYKMTPKLDLSLGYQFVTDNIGESELTDQTDVLITDSYDRTSHFFNVGARGKLLPKLDGFFKIGYQYLNPENSARTLSGTPISSLQRDSQSILGLDVNFNYLISPKLTSNMQLNRSFDVGSEGQSVTNTSLNLSADYKVSGNFVVHPFFRFSLRDFEDGVGTGKDNIYNTGIRLAYILDQYLRFSAGYLYSNNDSNRQGQGYVNNSIDFSIAFRY